MSADRLDSWKDIAQYLGRDVRTVRRWERHRALPVHRVPRGRLGRVFAYRRELEQWLAGTGSVENEKADVATPTGEIAPGARGWFDSRPRIFAGGLVAALVVTAAAVGSALWRETVPQQVAVSGNHLVALDEAGVVQWAHAFDPSKLIRVPAVRTHIADLDGDNRSDVLASIELTQQIPRSDGGELLRFSADGRVLWTTTVQDRVGFREGEYGPPWTAGEVTVYRVDGEPRIAWSLHHFTWWPSLLVTFDGAGRRLGTFVNSGWMRGATASIDDRSLYVSGVSNSRSAYFVAALDAAHVTGRSPEPDGSSTECVNCPAGNPLRYVVLPRSDVSQHQRFPGDSPSVQTFADGTVQVHTFESGGPSGAAIIYYFTSDLRLRYARFADSYWEWHRQLESEGKLRHSTETCPHRDGLELHEWTSAAGWHSSKVQVQ